MSSKHHISPEQWKALLNAPGATSAYVSSASGGALDKPKELATTSQFLEDLSSQAGGSGYGTLVDRLLSAMKGMSIEDKKKNTHQYQAKDKAGLRAEARQIVADAAAAAATQPEGDGFKRWLMELARQVAQTKTGGILGFGGRSVINKKEQAALDELASLLGM